MLIRRVARPMLSAVFISRGVESLRSPKPAADATRQTLDGLSKLPDPVGTNVPSDAETVAKVNAAVQIGGGLLLATGKFPRIASIALAASVVPGSLGGNAFWNQSDPQRKSEERKAFITDISLLGGLIIAAVDTEGKPSLGWRGRRAAHKVSEAVSAALPVGAAAGSSLSDSEFADKLGHGLHVGAERGRELAHLARERGEEWAEVAQKRGEEWAEVAQKRGGEWAEIAQKRGGEFADVARERGEGWAELARHRGTELAGTALDRAPDLADTARGRGHELAGQARGRAAKLTKAAEKQAKVAEKHAKAARKEARKQRRKL
ncbi:MULTISPECIES: DoxX family protein [Mycobacteriaceae]|uniref:DoxX family membrane protein n=1 Tax=Mycolicibacterium parafortuitum TaxID=39692 RepID=A0ACC6MMX6_MYCPF|nr:MULTISPECIES: DoxX family protein [Mycobacteriaceae]MDZ5088285.1 DoxX family membrane protein [Mycolicibacterium parafortuitum]